MITWVTAYTDDYIIMLFCRYVDMFQIKIIQNIIFPFYYLYVKRVSYLEIKALMQFSSQNNLTSSTLILLYYQSALPLSTVNMLGSNFSHSHIAQVTADMTAGDWGVN